ncbi:MAG: tail fiber domain-containing protein [Limnohabitans sp.]|nr:tail fiber domain-containing protein [Limnohabitans sp.]
MKKILVALTLFSGSMFAQVGISTTSPQAALDVVSSTNGILIPRVSLTALNVASPVVNPSGVSLVNGTLVYNTATSGVSPNQVVPGFYYWDNTKWVRLNAELSWLTKGNEGTNAAVNFIGTLDDNDLVFKRNNIVSGKVTTSNTSFGTNALSNTSSSGTKIVAIGVNALKSLTTGSDNIALGYGALEANTVGYQNVAIGSSTLSQNTNGNYNTGVGYNSLVRNTGGILNTAIGNNSMYNNLSGNSNVGIGSSTLQRNISGSKNVAVGVNAVYNNQTGSNNIGIGDAAMERNTSGEYNIALGNSSLYNNQNTSYNIAIGHEAQTNNQTNNNTSVGHQTLYTNTSGSGNTAIGYKAYFSGSYNNGTAIGNNTAVTADNQIRFGNSAVTSIGGFANWTNVSDKRFKKSIRYNTVPGLNFVMKLKPTTYYLDGDYISKAIYQGNKDIKTSEILQTGFIAQEVETAAKEVGYDFSGVDKPKNENDFYGLKYAEFVVPLTKAIQEQQQIIESLKNEIEVLKSKINEIKK